MALDTLKWGVEGAVAVVYLGSGNSAGRCLEVQTSTVSPGNGWKLHSEWKEVVGNRIIASRKKPHDIESQATD